MAKAIKPAAPAKRAPAKKKSIADQAREEVFTPQPEPEKTTAPLPLLTEPAPTEQPRPNIIERLKELADKNKIGLGVFVIAIAVSVMLLLALRRKEKPTDNSRIEALEKKVAALIDTTRRLRQDVDSNTLFRLHHDSLIKKNNALYRQKVIIKEVVHHYDKAPDVEPVRR